VVATSEVIDIAGLAGRPLVASSIGAMLALEVSAVRPEAFTRLVLVAPFGLWDPSEPVTDPFATTLRSQRELLTVDPARTAGFFDPQPGRSTEQLVEDDIARYLSRTAAASLIWPIPEFGFSTRAHRVTCPVTLVWGGLDRIIPPSYLDRFTALLPNVVATRVIEGAGHLVEWDAPDLLAAEVVPG
jgi:pimeloyl-ACP methyl ester carboxylesterase